jgi:hypothetical protein
MDTEMFRVASENNIDLHADSVSEFIRKCIENVVHTVNIKTYPNQKLWMDCSLRTKVKARTTAFNHGKRTGNIAEYKQYSYSLRKAIKQAKCWYRDKVESQFNGSVTRCMWQGLQAITDHQNKENQPLHGHRCIASRQTKHFLCPLSGQYSATDMDR